MEYLISFAEFNRMNDHFVKFIFMNQKHKNLLISLINSVIKFVKFPSIDDVIFQDREINKEHHKEKGGSVDVLCLANDGRLYNLEFQNEKEIFLINRVFYYLARFTINIRAGADYDEVRMVSNISFLNHRYFNDLDDKYYIHPFLYQHQIVKDYYLNNSSMFYIEIPKWEKVKPEIDNFTDLDVFLAFFSEKSSYEYLMEIAKRSEIMAQLMNLQDEYRKSYDLFQGYKTAEDYARDYRSVVNTNREEEREQTAIAMLKDNKPLDEIIKYSRLSSERVEEIRATLQ